MTDSSIRVKPSETNRGMPACTSKLAIHWRTFYIIVCTIDDTLDRFIERVPEIINRL